MAEITEAQHQKNYDQIIALYDYAEKLIDTVEDEATKNPAKQLELIEPLIETIENSTDVFAEKYRDFVQKDKIPGPLGGRRKLDKAVRGLYQSLEDCRAKLANSNGQV